MAIEMEFLFTLASQYTDYHLYIITNYNSEDEQNVTPPKTSPIDGYTFCHCFAGYCCSDLNWTTVSLPLLGFSVV